MIKFSTETVYLNHRKTLAVDYFRINKTVSESINGLRIYLSINGTIFLKKIGMQT